jgi:lipopolysaccharide biosynthesis glycosyltransferase
MNIVFISDNNYIKPTAVAVHSIIANAKTAKNLNFFVLGDSLTEDSIGLLKNSGAKNIKIIPSENLLSDLKNLSVNRHVSHSALLKFFLPQIFKDFDKVLYLDSDILVQKDLSELYNTNINDFYAAVIKDTLCVKDSEYMKQVKIYNKFYFNSGVMLLNLRKMREDNITEKMLHYRQTIEQHFMDQDTFNAIIGHNVKYISYKYNFLNYYLTIMTPSELSEFFGEKLEKTHERIYNDCTIIHLGGREKPWQEYLPILTEKYIPYATKTYWFLPFLSDAELFNLRKKYKFLHKITFGNTRKKFKKIYKSIFLPKPKDK